MNWGMALYGSLSTIKAQLPHVQGFATAFAYLDEMFRAGSVPAARIHAQAVGTAQKIELGGGMFVMEQVYQTKTRAEVFFETHRKMIDIQVVIEGVELMEVADFARLTVREPYNPDRDLIIYHDTAEASQWKMHTGQAAVYFPVDAHMGSLRLGGAPALVRKCVVKVPVTG